MTILGAILAIWVVFMTIGGIFATLKTFVIIALIAVAVFIVVALLSRRCQRLRWSCATNAEGGSM